MTKTTKDTLHLVLKKKWYDMIASGEKKEEYREHTAYYETRLLEQTRVNYRGNLLLTFKPYKQVCFHLGYTNTTMTFKIAGFDYDRGKEEWGALPYHTYFIIRLGERLA